MKDYDKYKEFSYLQYWDVNNLSRWAMSQVLPINDFRWVENTSQFSEDFIEICNEESDKGCFLKLMFNIFKSCMIFKMVYSFYQTK